MSQSVRVGSPDELLPDMIEKISRGEGFWLTVTGGSMFPTLHDESDSVYIEPLNRRVRVGEIPLVLDGGEHCILHRVIRMEGDVFFLRGDALFRVEGPIPSASILGIATLYRRNEKVRRLSGRRPLSVFVYRGRFFCMAQIRLVYRKLFRKRNMTNNGSNS